MSSKTWSKSYWNFLQTRPIANRRTKRHVPKARHPVWVKNFLKTKKPCQQLSYQKSAFHGLAINLRTLEVFKIDWCFSLRRPIKSFFWLLLKHSMCHVKVLLFFQRSLDFLIPCVLCCEIIKMISIRNQLIYVQKTEPPCYINLITSERNW